MKALLLGPAWVGDMVMAQSLVAAIQQRHPGAAIDLLAPPATAPLGERMPGIRTTRRQEVAHGRLDIAERVRLGWSLRPERYDLAIVLQNSFKSAVPALLSGIPIRRGYVGEFRYGLLNQPRRLDKARLPRTIDRFVALADDDGAAIAVVPPRLRHDAESARAVAARLGLNADARPVIGFCPGAEYGPAKQWPARHFAELAAILSRAGYAIWMFGSPKDRAFADEIVGLARARDPSVAIENVCGRTSLAEAIDLMSLTAAVVSNDSGLMHVAAAIDRPVVALFGSTTPAMTPPLARSCRILQIELPCRPCFERTCPLGHLDCLNRIDAGLAAAAVMEIAEPPPS